MIDDELDLDEIFREEATEEVSRLQKYLIELETGIAGIEREGKIREIFRLAHSLKGSAATVGRKDLAEIAHALETSLDLVRKGSLEPTRELISGALAAVDILQSGILKILNVEVIKEICERMAKVRSAGNSIKSPAAEPGRVDLPVVVAPKRRKKAEKLPGQLNDFIMQLASFGSRPAEEESGTLQAALEKLCLDAPTSKPKFIEIARKLQMLFALLPPSKPIDRVLIESAFMAADLMQTELAVGTSEEEMSAVRNRIDQMIEVTQRMPTSSVPAEGAVEPLKSADSSPSVSEASVRIQVSLLDSILYRLDELVAAKLRIDYQRHQVEEAQETLDLSLTQVRGGIGDFTLELENHKRRLEHIRRDLSQEVHYLGIVAQGLQEDVKEVRMVPLGPVLDPLRRMVRDLSQSLGKDAVMEVVGEQVRVDKRLLELLRDPLNHLLRNSLDHGLETTAERIELGKPPRGKLKVIAESRDSQIWIEVSDDGQGISSEKVKAAAISKGIIESERAAALSEREILNLIFSPGFSTAREVTELSGRGVGLDVVRENVGRLGGRIEFFTEMGKGTRFSLCLPLTLTASRGLMVISGKQTFCIPITAVDEVVGIEPKDIGFSQGHLGIQWRNQAVTFAPLADLLSGRPSVRPDARGYAVVIALSDRRLALGVDELLGQEEVVVKGLASGTPSLHFVAGATSLADGRLVTVLEPAALVEAAINTGARTAVKVTNDRPFTILVADDALTSRTLVASVLERSGYRTLVAPDGESAYSILARGEKVDLLVSDVEMPALDGYALARRIRSSSEFSDLPIILVTSLDSPEERARGAEAGASAYMVKQEFDPSRFLGIIADYLGKRRSTG